jgi:tetratricopeptide (TPR) repeat protein
MPLTQSRRRRALLLAPLLVQCGAAKKRKQPAVPAELHTGCPFHREQADVAELSEFGHELERDGRKPEAERCYAKAIRSSPRAATGWFDLAVARQYSDQSAAVRYYRHGLALLPSAFHYNQFGVIMRQKERHGEAAQHFRTAAKLQPADADPLFNLGGSHELLQQPAEALRAYRGALERERKNEARIHNNIGTQLGKLDRWRRGGGLQPPPPAARRALPVPAADPSPRTPDPLLPEQVARGRRRLSRGGGGRPGLPRDARAPCPKRAPLWPHGVRHLDAPPAARTVA